MNYDEVQCPHCDYVCDIGGLIGETTDDCPKCGGRVLGGEVESPIEQTASN